MQRSKVLFTLATALSLCCGPLNDIAGTSSGVETKTAVVRGSIVDQGGESSTNTIVRLIPAAYNPAEDGPLADSLLDTTDAAGAYRIRISETGSFNIQAENIVERTNVLIRGIMVHNTEIAVSTDTVRKPGTILVEIPSGTDPTGAYLFIPGTMIYSPLSTGTGYVLLNAVPAGTIPAIYYGVKNSSVAPLLIADSIVVPPGATVSTGYGKWSFSTNFHLNTTSSGAGVMGNVLDFPILIRLSSGNFNFGEAKSDGSDIRFVKSDGTPLFFEIERWDRIAAEADVWVRVDTVYGNNETQFITMLWGNPDAQAVSSSTVVFDTGNGFRGVWHLGNDSDNPTVKDAVGRNNGVMKSGSVAINTSSANAKGIVGGSVHFRGKSIKHWVDLGKNKGFINKKEEITISVWMNPDSTTTDAPQLLSFTKGGALTPLNLESRVSLSLAFDNVRLQARALDDGQLFSTISAKTITVQQWYFVTGVIKVPQDSIYLYVNGTLWTSRSVAFRASFTDITNSTSSMMGADDYGLDDYFYGKIDEARIEDVARSADWIKLCYMNQKEVDAFVK